MTGERARHIYVKGRIAFSFGKNGEGLSDEFDIINQITNLFSKDNYVTIHKSFIDQCDDVYDLIFDIEPRNEVDYLLKDDEKNIA
jgi:hypothetical protein